MRVPDLGGADAAARYPEWGRADLLASYSSDLVDGFRHAGSYVAKILGGARPDDCRSMQPSKFTW
jgi:putative tryptophan/tyrosine transport system substrate-binding protein